MTTQAILVDIEGTVGSIAFVREVLFPYAHRALPGFIEEHGRQPDVRRWLGEVAIELGQPTSDEAITRALQGWMDEDRKHTALKALQGMVWEAGYRRGDFRSHVYADAAAALRAWHDAGRTLAVYSSGSVPAQKLFFAHTEAGDLSSMISAWFDTETGPKRDATSYERIARTLDRSPGDVVFLSDVVEELDAARTAGMATVLVDRREDYAAPRRDAAAGGHRRVERIAAILLE